LARSRAQGHISSWDRDPIRAARGRRRYHAERRVAAELRRNKVLKLLIAYGGSGPAIGRSIAGELGMSEHTIQNDITAILATPNGPRRCPLCRSITEGDDWEEVEA
jgi:DNA-binding CsgD family transcriptional regulator